MNTFRTVIPASNFSFKISHNDSIMCLGSCFTENIGHFLSTAKFKTLINPHGIIYNPLSINIALNHIIENIAIKEADLVTMNSRYYHWDFHGDLSRTDAAKTLELLNKQISSAHKFIKEANILFLTLGAANVFKLIDEDRIVANCHKFPNDQFIRVELSVDEMIDQLQRSISKLQETNPRIKIVFTVSPVRHIRDGLINNQLSKAKLIQTVHHLCCTNEYVHYFPSYELIMDDLRDYRFYTRDMIHVNEAGLDYIWDYFKRSFFTDQSNTLVDHITRIKKDLAHKPFYPDSEEHQAFLQKLRSKIENLVSKESHLDFEEELAILSKQIAI